MASVYVIARKSERTGKRSFLVRYRLGGRETPALHGGTFPTRRLADERADVLRGFIARGEVPRLDIIEATSGTPATVMSVSQDYLEARKVDAADGTRKLYTQAQGWLGKLGDLMPSQVTVKDVQDWINEMNQSLAPGSVKKYRDYLRLVLDHADIEPNPARSRKVRLPANDAEEIKPPPFEHWVAILTALSPRFRLHALVMENTGLRIGELFAMTWGDVDIRGGRLLVERTRTKGQRGSRRSRWVYPTPEIMELIDELQPVEDRVMDAPIFDGSEPGFRRAMTSACKFAKVPHYYPHHLRHRFISLRYAAGWPSPNVCKAAGHSKKSETEDRYAHVLIDEPDEILMIAASERERWSRGASVVPNALDVVRD